MDISVRMKQIEKLDQFINDKHKLLNDILGSLEWTQESLKDEVKVTCPVNSQHWVPESSLDKHIETCKWIQNGYIKDDLDKGPPDSSYFYEKASSVISVPVDHAVTEQILSQSGLINEGYDSSTDFPKTGDRWTVHMTPSQRLAVYDYVVEKSNAALKAKNVTVEDLMLDFEPKNSNDTPKVKSELEMLAEMRDYKRRRQSYRAKNVHITKKSYTEIMREVIENQTSYLTEILKQENSDNVKNTHENSDDNNRNDNDNSSEDSSRHRVHQKRKKEKHSKHKSSKDSSPKRKKHKRDRSRSRSTSRHKHKKKSHKRKRSHS